MKPVEFPPFFLEQLFSASMPFAHHGPVHVPTEQADHLRMLRHDRFESVGLLLVAIAANVVLANIKWWMVNG